MNDEQYRMTTEVPFTVSTSMFNRMLGMNNLVAALNNISYEDNKYPPHNVYKDGDNYVVEIALAGWEEDDISVIVENLELTVKGEKQDSSRTEKQMSHKGISTKNFNKKFVIGVDRSKMRLYDAENSAQTDLSDSGQAIPDKPLNTFGNRENKFQKKNFGGLKV